MRSYSGNYRAPFINYRNPGIFMITMLKANQIPYFSTIVHTEKKGFFGNAKVILSPLGKIVEEYLFKFSSFFDDIYVVQFIIMPDHIHFIVQIKKRLNETLGANLARFKRLVFHAANERSLIPLKYKSLFLEGFNDQFLRRDRSLNVLFQYVRENPQRYIRRKLQPDFFVKSENINLAGENCQTYGNNFLLKNPFISPVIIHRKDSQIELEKKIIDWQYIMNNGGVLIGAFISKKEKEILSLAIKNEAKIILIRNKLLKDREKPTGKIFKMCEKGLLLMININSKIEESRFDNEGKISREICLRMNELAERISKISLKL